eukprot:maker-scaffold_33-snap-gene-1.48-mRNA-1 protein AED:0.27 eAED:0.29 QI:0/0/0/1/1/1/2/0/552
MGFVNKVFEENGIFFSCLGAQGDRQSMEDAFSHLITSPEPSTPPVYIFSVFDGHGGSNCSKFCKETVPRVLASHPDLRSDPRKALRETFLQVDAQYLKLAEAYEDLDDGSTATVLLLQMMPFKKNKPDRLKYYLACAGDSRAVLVKKKAVEQLSRDHSAELEDERQRILKCGGEVSQDEYGARVVSEFVGELSVTRAVGDLEFKNLGVIAEPEINEGWVDESKDLFFVLASDGLWGQVNNDECGEILKKENKKRKGKKTRFSIVGPPGEVEKNDKKGFTLERKILSLTQLAKQRDNEQSELMDQERSCDNITICVVDVKLLNEEVKKFQYKSTAFEKDADQKKLEDERKRKERLAKVERRKTLTVLGLNPHGDMAGVLLWKRPIRSALWFVIGCLVYFLLQIGNYSVMTLVSYLLAAQLVVNLVMVRFSNLFEPITRQGMDNFNAVEFIKEGTFFTDDFIDKVCLQVSIYSANYLSKWRKIVYEVHPDRLLKTMRNITYLFTPINLPELFFIGFLSSFSLLATYDRNRAVLDRIYNKFWLAVYKVMYKLGIK